MRRIIPLCPLFPAAAQCRHKFGLKRRPQRVPVEDPDDDALEAAVARGADRRARFTRRPLEEPQPATTVFVEGEQRRAMPQRSVGLEPVFCGEDRGVLAARAEARLATLVPGTAVEATALDTAEIGLDAGATLHEVVVTLPDHGCVGRAKSFDEGEARYRAVFQALRAASLVAATAAGLEVPSEAAAPWTYRTSVDFPATAYYPYDVLLDSATAAMLATDADMSGAFLLRPRPDEAACIPSAKEIEPRWRTPTQRIVCDVIALTHDAAGQLELRVVAQGRGPSEMVAAADGLRAVVQASLAASSGLTVSGAAVDEAVMSKHLRAVAARTLQPQQAAGQNPHMVLTKAVVSTLGTKIAVTCDLDQALPRNVKVFRADACITRRLEHNGALADQDPGATLDVTVVARGWGNNKKAAQHHAVVAALEDLFPSLAEQTRHVPAFETTDVVRESPAAYTGAVSLPPLKPETVEEERQPHAAGYLHSTPAPPVMDPPAAAKPAAISKKHRAGPLPTPEPSPPKPSRLPPQPRPRQPARRAAPPVDSTVGLPEAIVASPWTQRAELELRLLLSAAGKACVAHAVRGQGQTGWTGVVRAGATGGAPGAVIAEAHHRRREEALALAFRAALDTDLARTCCDLLGLPPSPLPPTSDSTETGEEGVDSSAGAQGTSRLSVYTTAVLAALSDRCGVDGTDRVTQLEDGSYRVSLVTVPGERLIAEATHSSSLAAFLLCYRAAFHSPLCAAPPAGVAATQEEALGALHPIVVPAEGRGVAPLDQELSTLWADGDPRPRALAALPPCPIAGAALCGRRAVEALMAHHFGVSVDVVVRAATDAEEADAAASAGAGIESWSDPADAPAAAKEGPADHHEEEIDELFDGLFHELGPDTAPTPAAPRRSFKVAASPTGALTSTSATHVTIHAVSTTATHTAATAVAATEEEALRMALHRAVVAHFPSVPPETVDATVTRTLLPSATAEGPLSDLGTLERDAVRAAAVAVAQQAADPDAARRAVVEFLRELPAGPFPLHVQPTRGSFTVAVKAPRAVAAPGVVPAAVGGGTAALTDTVTGADLFAASAEAFQALASSVGAPPRKHSPRDSPGALQPPGKATGVVAQHSGLQLVFGSRKLQLGNTPVWEVRALVQCDSRAVDPTVPQPPVVEVAVAVDDAGDGPEVGVVRPSVLSPSTTLRGGGVPLDSPLYLPLHCVGRATSKRTALHRAAVRVLQRSFPAVLEEAAARSSAFHIGHTDADEEAELARLAAQHEAEVEAKREARRAAEALQEAARRRKNKLPWENNREATAGPHTDTSLYGVADADESWVARGLEEAGDTSLFIKPKDGAAGSRRFQRRDSEGAEAQLLPLLKAAMGRANIALRVHTTKLPGGHGTQIHGVPVLPSGELDLVNESDVAYATHRSHGRSVALACYKALQEKYGDDLRRALQDNPQLLDKLL